MSHQRKSLGGSHGRSSVLPIRLCPLVLAVAAILLALGNLL